MGSLSSVLQAKETAVLRCTELLLPKNVKRRRIRICSDSRVAIAALNNNHHRIGSGMGQPASARKTKWI
jgi:ribosomal protein L16/L10AE